MSNSAAQLLYGPVLVLCVCILVRRSRGRQQVAVEGCSSLRVAMPSTAQLSRQRLPHSQHICRVHFTTVVTTIQYSCIAVARRQYIIGPVAHCLCIRYSLSVLVTDSAQHLTCTMYKKLLYNVLLWTSVTKTIRLMCLLVVAAPAGWEIVKLYWGDWPKMLPFQYQEYVFQFW